MADKNVIANYINLSTLFRYINDFLCTINEKSKFLFHKVTKGYIWFNTSAKNIAESDPSKTAIYSAIDMLLHRQISINSSRLVKTISTISSIYKSS